jgi:hypothetical protein
MKRSFLAAFVMSALSVSVVLVVSSGFTTIAQQTADPAQPNLVGETINAKPPQPVLPITIDKVSCSLPKPHTFQGTATGPLPGDVKTITIEKLSQDRQTNNGVFRANFEVDGGKLSIQNDSFKQATPLNCTAHEGIVGPHERHFKFKFVTDYNATLPNQRHVCGEATVSGQFGYATGGLVQSFSETINTQNHCK